MRRGVSHWVSGQQSVSSFQYGQNLPCLIQVMHHHARGVTRRAINLLSIPCQRESVVADQFTQPVLYVQQQTVKLISGSCFDFHWVSVSSIFGSR